MEERDLPAAPSDLNAKYEDAIRKKLVALMRASGYSQIHFCEMLQERGLGLEQGNLSSMLKGRKHIPLSLIVHICDIFKISLAELVDENFGGARQVGGSSPAAQVYSDDLLQLIPDLGDKFVVDPDDSHFFGYLQTYYIYLFHSDSDDSRVRTGTLRLSARSGLCEAVLSLNSNKVQDGKPYVKVYRGRCIISTTMRAVFILMTNRDTGELMVLNFRYFNLVQYPLDCRLACALLNSTGSEHHSPVVQRMFLSRTEISAKDLQLLLPHLLLNSNTICIQKEQLDALRSIDSSYPSPIDDLTLTNLEKSFYCLDEDDVRSAARRHMSKPEMHRFLAMLRSLSNSTLFHKVGRRADEHSHKFLRSLGYYHDFEN